MSVLTTKRWWLVCTLAGAALSCESTTTRVIGLDEVGSTIELKVGDTVRFELRDHIATTRYREQILPEPLIVALIHSEETGGTGSKDLTNIFEYKAVGGGTTRVVFIDTQSQYPFTFVVDGPSREDEIWNAYRGFKPAGGFGASTESGATIRALALRPVSMRVGVDGLLSLVSDGNLWTVDTAAGTASVRIDAAGPQSPLPSGAAITAIDQRGSADWLLGLRTGGDDRVGWLRASGQWEELQRWADDAPILQVRIAPDGVGWVALTGEGSALSHSSGTFEQVFVGSMLVTEAHAAEFGSDGRLYVQGSGASAVGWLAGIDSRGRLLTLQAAGDQGSLNRLDEETLLTTKLFDLSVGAISVSPTLDDPEGRAVPRRFDFGVACGALRATVTQLPDGAWWASGVMREDVACLGNGLFVHR